MIAEQMRNDCNAGIYRKRSAGWAPRNQPARGEKAEREADAECLEGGGAELDLGLHGSRR